MKRRGLAIVAAVVGALGADAVTAMELDACLAERDLRRVARVVDPEGRVVYARVLEQRDGRPVRLAYLADATTPLDRVFELAARDGGGASFEVTAARVCASVDLPQAELDAETRVIVSTGLNFAAHAEEAGGGDVFLFPKPAAPTAPYARLHPPAGVTLLDYEIELAFVLLEDIDPSDPPSREALLASTAFFLTNDVSDREPIILAAALSGPGTGFVEGKGQPGFLPAGPWLVRGSELFAALEACGGDGLGLRLFVDEGEGPVLRQSASTALMILDPHELIAYIGEQIDRLGRRTAMPFVKNGQERFYPLAVGEERPLLTAGSIVQTGTPEGVAISAPGALGVTLRGLVHLRSPFAQFLAEEQARIAAGTRGSYLKPGDRVRAQIDGLGTQEFEIGVAGTQPEPHACRVGGPVPASRGA